MKQYHTPSPGIMIIIIMLFLFTIPISTKFTYLLYNFIIGIAVGGAISLGINENRYKKPQIFPQVMAVIVPFIVVFFSFIGSHFDIETMMCHPEAMNMLLPSGIIYGVCSVFLIICFTLVVFYGIRKKADVNKKYIFAVLILASFFIYLFFSFDLYVLSLYGSCRDVGSKYEISMSDFLFYDFGKHLSISATCQPFVLCGQPDFAIASFLISCCKKITFNKISDEHLLTIINIQSWITGFLITLLSGWIFISFTSFSKKADYIQKDCEDEAQIRQNIKKFLLIVLIFSGIILFGIWQYVRKPDRDKLNYACETGNIQMVEKILMERPDLINNRDDYYANTPLFYPAENNSKHIVEFLISKGADVNAKNSLGDTPLHYAARNGKKEMMEFLVNKGAVLNIKGNHCTTPLHLASSKASVDTVEFLIKNGADMNEKDKDGELPLHYAAGSDNWEVMKFFLNKGVDVNASDKYGRTVLFSPVLSGNKEITEFLIKNGADVTAADFRNMTSFHYAVKGGNKEIVELLIKKGADVNAKDKEGKTPLDYALESDKKEIIDFLEKHGAK